MRSREKILFVVHEQTAKGWARREPIYAISDADQNNAQRLLRRLSTAKKRYDRTIQFEFDPWETAVPSTSRYTWKQVADEVGRDSTVHVVGLRRTVCVAKVTQELAHEGVRATIHRPLTID